MTVAKAGKPVLRQTRLFHRLANNGRWSSGLNACHTPLSVDDPKPIAMITQATTNAIVDSFSNRLTDRVDDSAAPISTSR
jgi:hypothetical protein